MGLNAEFYQNLKGDIIPILLKLFHKIKREKGIQILLIRPALPCYQNQIYTYKRQIQTNLSDNKFSIFSKSKITLKEFSPHNQFGFIPVIEG